MSAAQFSAVYQLANLTAPASGVTHGAQWNIGIIGGQTVVLSMQSQMEFLGDFIGQGMIVDNTGNSTDLVVHERTYGWTRIIAAGTLRAFQYPACENQVFTFSTSGDSTVNISVLDWPVFPDVFLNSAAAAGTDVVVTNTVSVTDAPAEASLSALQSAVSLTSRSTTTVAATSTALMAANASRKYLLIAAPSGADVWLNPIGGTAGIGLTDCVPVYAGGQYESASRVWNGVINYYCATGSLVLAAFEG